MNQGYLDTLTIFAAAAVKTSAVRLGTAIVQTYPRGAMLIKMIIYARELTLPLGIIHSSSASVLG
jgi:hypothetical protein